MWATWCVIIHALTKFINKWSGKWRKHHLGVTYKNLASQGSTLVPLSQIGEKTNKAKQRLSSLARIRWYTIVISKYHCRPMNDYWLTNRDSVELQLDRRVVLAEAQCHHEQAHIGGDGGALFSIQGEWDREFFGNDAEDERCARVWFERVYVGNARRRTIAG